MSEHVCPLCQRPEKPGKAKELYGTSVCRKCWTGFGNRRQGAYIIDAVAWWPIATGIILGLAFLAEALAISKDTVGPF